MSDRTPNLLSYQTKSQSLYVDPKKSNNLETFFEFTHADFVC